MTGADGKECREEVILLRTGALGGNGPRSELASATKALPEDIFKTNTSQISENKAFVWIYFDKTFTATS